MRVAVVQMAAGADKKRNIEKALKLIRRAAKRQARWVVLPEIFNYRGPFSKKQRGVIAETIPGESTLPFMELAARHKIFILLGSIYEKSRDPRKAYNTSILIDNCGRIQTTYRKINLFHAVIGGRTLYESDKFLSGTRRVVGKVGDFSAGMTICYDLRFPELYRYYFHRGVQILCVPSCFTKKTGMAHWETLLRARAIENFCYVLAPNQYGKDSRGVAAYGNSMIIGPWGEILARASGNKEEILYADLDLQALRKPRSILPSVAN